MSYIGLGKCSKYYLYILGAIIFRILKECLFGFIGYDPESKGSLFGFIPELANHFLLQQFYRYISFIIGGIIFMIITKKNSMTEEEKNLNKKKNLELKGLIHNKKKASSEKVHFIKIFSVCLIFCLHAELSRIMYLFDFDGLDFWIFDIIFTLFFMDTYFKIKYYNHQKFSMIFIIIINSIL